ncbi:uncharacterized protein PITG_14790 [Phytophthora infestans T30-4]|uniref:GPI inositol-deacylase n=1 Tax=Phytophthora infestans (strain T30-4) TaxID=403677 RepID=D0NP22_PHYIT|nr:uncharacterized protein PITG_14790 [Phytophthora infestans T30-4]EEY62364.1 conserved hypothetical protein [Phytophthora infestans T30-4]|eukprot:XP_002899000.1 conserved hypothetical protein [Phytophthora infestans T30-4]
MYGSDMDITVEYVNTRANISIPIATSTDLPDSEFGFTWGDDSTCSCKSTPRPCIFIHGMGVPYELPDNQDSLFYWGNLTGHTPCCTTVKYAVLDTINNTWTNHSQQHKVCNRALAVSKTSKDNVISDTIIVSHSMGNLMLAGVIASGKCSLDSSSTWVGIAAPMKGNQLSHAKMAKNSGRCPPTTALKSMSYGAQKDFQSNVSALMCSTESKFGKTWKNRFYRTKLNLYDIQFKHGDGLFSKAMMPVKWLECLL